MPEDDEQARERLVANERAKLSATDLNGLAMAVVVVGGLSPILSDGGAVRIPEGIDPLHAVLSATRLLVCLAASALLHFLPRRLLGDLR